MDESNGDVVTDQSGNGFDGLTQGSPEWVAGLFGGGMQFNGSGDRVEIEDNEMLRFGVDDSFTAMAWVFIPEEAGSGWRGIVTKSRDLFRHWGIWINPQDQWVYGEGGNFLMLGQIEEGWHHLAIIQDADDVIQYLYLDGDVLGDHGGVVAQDGAGDLWFGGAKSVNEWFIGTLDEVRVYDEALSAAELLTIMAGPTLGGDFNGNRVLDAADIDMLSAEVRSGLHKPAYDLNSDALVNDDDRTKWVEVLKHTYYGDANLDGEFSSTDFVGVFVAGKYEDAIDGNAGWAEGDWDGSGDFNSSDFVLAFVGGGYELGPRGPLAASAVPEPSAALLTLMALTTLTGWRRRRNHP